MKIYVKDGNTGHKIRLALPSRLIFGKFGQAIVKRAIKSELKHNSSDEECVADTNIDADGLGMAELDDTTSFDMFDEEEQLEQAVENADALPDNEKPDAPASSNKTHELNGAQVSELMKIILEIGIASWNAPPEKVLIYAGFRGFENEKIFEFSPSVLPIFQSGLGEDTTWRVVRVVEGATLEKSCAARHLGFESLTLRQPEKPVLPASLFYSRFPIPKPASIASAEITFELYSRCA